MRLARLASRVSSIQHTCLSRRRRCVAMDAEAVGAKAVVTVHKLALAHTEEAATVLRTVFDNEYSWSRPLNMPQERFEYWMRNMYIPERAAATPSSLVALAEDSTVAGVCTLEDFFEPESEEKEADPPAGMRCVEGILGACKELFYAQAAKRGLHVEKGRTGIIAYVAFLAVNSNFRRQRVGHRLVQQAVQQLTVDGPYGTAVAFCTSFKSRALFQQIGFQYWGGVSYQTFSMEDGSIPFATLPKDECAVLVWTGKSG